jgi:hypothetical protein
MNADVINVEQIRNMSTSEKDNVIDMLIKTVQQQSEALMKKPVEIPSANILQLAEFANNAMKKISEKPGDAESKKVQMREILKHVKDYLGSTSDILLNVVKLAQIFGIN